MTMKSLGVVQGAKAIAEFAPDVARVLDIAVPEDEAVHSVQVEGAEAAVVVRSRGVGTVSLCNKYVERRLDVLCESQKCLTYCTHVQPREPEGVFFTLSPYSTHARRIIHTEGPKTDSRSVFDPPCNICKHIVTDTAYRGDQRSSSPPRPRWSMTRRKEQSRRSFRVGSSRIRTPPGTCSRSPLPRARSCPPRTAADCPPRP